MKCQLCQKELEAYHEGLLPEGTKAQVELHLSNCKECSEILQMLILADKVMSEEKSVQSNPFLSTRIMAGIEALEQAQASVQGIPAYQRLLKPVLISISVAAAIFIGVFAGNIYSPHQTLKAVPVEMAYMNDAALESVSMFSNGNN